MQISERNSGSLQRLLSSIQSLTDKVKAQDRAIRVLSKSVSFQENSNGDANEVTIVSESGVTQNAISPRPTNISRPTGVRSSTTVNTPSVSTDPHTSSPHPTNIPRTTIISTPSVSSAPIVSSYSNQTSSANTVNSVSNSQNQISAHITSSVQPVNSDANLVSHNADLCQTDSNMKDDDEQCFPLVRMLLINH